MESVGEYLKRERELRGVGLAEISRTIKVQEKFLKAIEADDAASLPHPAFVKGFIRAYCGCLGLDETDAVLRYEDSLAEAVGQETGAPSGTETSGARNPAALAAASLVGLLLLIGVLLYLRGGGVEEQAATEPEPYVETRGAEPTAVIKTEDGSTLSEGVAPVEGHSLVVRATALTWMKVSMDDEPAIEALLRPGEEAVWNAKEGFSLVLGNAGGVELVFDGRPLGRPGKPGTVVEIRLPESGG